MLYMLLTYKYKTVNGSEKMWMCLLRREIFHGRGCRAAMSTSKTAIRAHGRNQTEWFGFL